jgi:hypothetical protein
LSALLAAVENRHANIWREKLREAGVQPREHGPSLRVRIIGFLARRFGVRSILPIVRGMEAGAYSMYMAQDETAQAIAPDEHEHGRTIARLQKPEVEPVAAIAGREKWHRTGGGGTLRATVFGVSDGLLSNTSLIMGFAGANTDGKFVLLAGVSGLWRARSHGRQRIRVDAGPRSSSRRSSWAGRAGAAPGEERSWR